MGTNAEQNITLEGKREKERYREREIKIFRYRDTELAPGSKLGLSMIN